MAKKSDSFYFGNFYACADCAYQAAHLLERVMRDFDPLLIREKLDDMHKVEHAADEKKHEVLDALVKLMLKEFASFRHSKSLRDHIIAINTLEEQADQVFVTSMRELHTTCTDPVEIICWREVYFYLEKCTDACEHVADVVEQIVMKNS